MKALLFALAFVVVAAVILMALGLWLGWSEVTLP